MTELPLAPVERVMRKSGAERISLEALKLAADELESFLRVLTQKAALLAKDDGRVTITSSDISTSAKILTQAIAPKPSVDY